MAGANDCFYFDLILMHDCHLTRSETLENIPPGIFYKIPFDILFQRFDDIFDTYEKTADSPYIFLIINKSSRFHFQEKIINCHITQLPTATYWRILRFYNGQSVKAKQSYNVKIFKKIF